MGRGGFKQDQDWPAPFAAAWLLAEDSRNGPRSWDSKDKLDYVGIKGQMENGAVMASSVCALAQDESSVLPPTHTYTQWKWELPAHPTQDANLAPPSGQTEIHMRVMVAGLRMPRLACR